MLLSELSLTSEWLILGIILDLITGNYVLRIAVIEVNRVDAEVSAETGVTPSWTNSRTGKERFSSRNMR
jgi:hypothetical protein